MRRTIFTAAPALLALGLLTAPASAAETASAEIIDADGKTIGTARLTEGPQGVLIEMRVRGLPAGRHGFHIHETGRCDPPSFESAGGHFNPGGHRHGLLNPQGPHAGDLPNIHSLGTGSVMFEVPAGAVTLKPGAANSLLDEDGSALVIHAGEDDLRSDPSGNSGARIACGVIRE